MTAAELEAVVRGMELPEFLSQEAIWLATN